MLAKLYRFINHIKNEGIVLIDSYFVVLNLLLFSYYGTVYAYVLFVTCKVCFLGSARNVSFNFEYRTDLF